MIRIRPVILCGGMGTRLWPLSVPSLPKAFLTMADGLSLLQKTALRFSRGGFLPPVVSGHAAQAQRITAHLAAVNIVPEQILLEPVARNTAASIASIAALRRGEEEVLLITPCDHLIDDEQVFRAVLRDGAAAAMEEWLTLLGMTCTSASTLYGYIRPGGALAGYPQARRVKEFVEKPSLPLAHELCKQGSCVWNSGLVLARAQPLLDAFARHRPDILASARHATAQARRQPQTARFYLDALAYATIPAIAFDRAVLEKSERLIMISAAVGWRDIGNKEVYIRELRLMSEKRAANKAMGKAAGKTAQGRRARS